MQRRRAPCYCKEGGTKIDALCTPKSQTLCVYIQDVRLLNKIYTEGDVSGNDCLSLGAGAGAGVGACTTLGHYLLDAFVRPVGLHQIERIYAYYYWKILYIM